MKKFTWRDVGRCGAVQETRGGMGDVGDVGDVGEIAKEGQRGTRPGRPWEPVALSRTQWRSVAPSDN